MLTFKALQDNVLTFLDQAGETGIGLDLVKYALNTSMEKRVSEERWSFMLWPTPVSLSFTQGVRTYQLHPELMMITDFWNTTGQQRMVEVPTRARFKEGVQEDRYKFEFVQGSPVRQQPTEGVLTVSGMAKIRYVDADGEVVEENVTNANTSASVSEVLRVTKLDTNALTITDAAAATILSLTASEFGKSYPQIRLFDDGQAETGAYRFYRKPYLMVDDYDIPDIPYPFSRILIFDALLELATYHDSSPPQHWVVQQGQWDLQLRQAYQEGEAEGSEARTVHATDDYSG